MKRILRFSEAGAHVILHDLSVVMLLSSRWPYFFCVKSVGPLQCGRLHAQVSSIPQWMVASEEEFPLVQRGQNCIHPVVQLLCYTAL